MSHLHQLTNNVKLLQKCLLVHNGELFLVQREPNSTSRPNCWDFPGGNSEWPTDIAEPTVNLHQQDIAREIQEEAGLTLDPEIFTLDHLILFETFFDPEKQMFTVLTGWRIDLPTDFDRTTIHLSEEHVDHTWATPSHALNFDFGGPRGRFMQRMIQGAFPL